MNLTDPATTFLISIVLQVLGIANLVAVRAYSDDTRGSMAQAMFFASLAVVGLFTVVMVFYGCVLWLPCSVTVAVMVLGATLDLRGSLTDSSC
jgi:hypothetical protein